MTEIPSQSGATTAPDDETTASFRVRTSAAVDRAGDALTDAAGKAREELTEFAGAAGEKLHDFADRAGDAIGDAASKATEEIAEATRNAVEYLKNNATIPSERGTTTIANEVVEKIAGIAARDVPGVYDLGGNTSRVISSLRERFGLGEESKGQGVHARLSGKEADVTVVLVLEYGFVVNSVCDKVREKVISAVEALLGLDVTNVDVLVDDVHHSETGPQGDAEQRAASYSSDTRGIKVGQ